MSWTMDQDGNWTSDTPEIDRDEELRREDEMRRKLEEDWLRQHTPDLQIVPVEQEREDETPSPPPPPQATGSQGQDIAPKP